MPKLELPQFHGEMEYWITFKELFQATVIDNSDLTEIDKFQYLFASVKGVEIYADLLEGLPIFGPAGTPTAIPTKLGYILSGKIYAPLKESIVNSSLNDQLSELWKLEEVPKTNAKIQIPDPCEESFSKSVKRNNEDTEVEAKSIIIEIQNLLKSGGFILRKWSSSHPKVLQDLDTSLLASKTLHSLGDEEFKQRVLGLIWNLKTDSIQVKVVHEEIVKTKRQLLSVIAQIFDPLGLFSPSVITLKIMLQELWKSKAFWDDPIPSSILENWNKFTKESKLLSLNIFLDEDEILRVGGRLTKQPTLSFDQKFPIIIPKHHPITTLVIRQFHLRGFHSGTQMTLSLIRQHYWIPDGRSTVRREIKRCIECCRFNSKPSYPKMGDLPKQRITQIRPFEIVGIDFAGPILTKCQHLRKANKFKSYICLFICLATKAVHLELVSTLSTDVMLAALRRFIARRGHRLKSIRTMALTS
ncbi:integrase catalytic domain-containing protein [Trichonephila clavipes]|nr:integrase catalytic domain-containing protein [Trichonephila clavipes]